MCVFLVWTITAYHGEAAMLMTSGVPLFCSAQETLTEPSLGKKQNKKNILYTILYKYITSISTHENSKLVVTFSLSTRCLCCGSPLWAAGLSKQSANDKQSNASY